MSNSLAPVGIVASIASTLACPGISCATTHPTAKQCIARLNSKRDSEVSLDVTEVVDLGLKKSPALLASC